MDFNKLAHDLTQAPMAAIPCNHVPGVGFVSFNEMAKAFKEDKPERVEYFVALVQQAQGVPVNEFVASLSRC